MAQQITFKIEVSPNSFLYIATQPNTSNTPLPLGLSHNPTSYILDIETVGPNKGLYTIKDPSSGYFLTVNTFFNSNDPSPVYCASLDAQKAGIYQYFMFTPSASTAQYIFCGAPQNLVFAAAASITVDTLVVFWILTGAPEEKFIVTITP